MNDQQPAPVLTRAHIFAAVFFALFIFLLYQAARLFTPFVSSLLWAGIITIALYPVYRRLLALVRGRAAIASGIMTLVTAVLIIGPGISALAALASQADDLYSYVSELLKSGRIEELWGRILDSPLGAIPGLPAVQELDIQRFVVEHLGNLSSRLAGQIGDILKNTLLLVVNLLIMIFALFFFFRDGEGHYRTAMDLLPFTAAQKEGMAQKFMDTFNAVIAGVFFIAILQGLMTGIGFAVFGVPFPALWGFLAAFLALLPVGGATLVWLPGAIYLFTTGATLKGVLLAVWGVLLVSTPDNFLKPLIIGKKAKIPTFFLFIAILGGIRAYGFLGILFGPVVVTLLTAFVQIYREEFASK
jgi:predicted PurR-regulated permease PerM